MVGDALQAAHESPELSRFKIGSSCVDSATESTTALGWRKNYRVVSYDDRDYEPTGEDFDSPTPRIEAPVIARRNAKRLQTESPGIELEQSRKKQLQRRSNEANASLSCKCCKGNHMVKDCPQSCGNCGRKGHQVKHCLGPVDQEGWLAACPGCNTKGAHLYDDCHVRKTAGWSRRDDHLLLVSCRACKPPIRSRLSFIELHLEQGGGYKRYLPQTATHSKQHNLAPMLWGTFTSRPLWQTWEYLTHECGYWETHQLAVNHGAEDPVTALLHLEPADSAVLRLLRQHVWVPPDERRGENDGYSCVSKAWEILTQQRVNEAKAIVEAYSNST